MDKSLPQITFDFSSGAGESKEPKEFLSGNPVPQQKPSAPKSTRGRKSLKGMEADADFVNVPEDEILFQKQYYAIGEVAAMFNVNTSQIRFWENEFDILEPRKNRKGDRFFKPVDVKNLQMIYDLLRRRKFTIEGAKDFLKKNKQAKEKYEMVESLQKLRAFLLQLKANL
jgi:DNA-binding transcriptional MerR regulator